MSHETGTRRAPEVAGKLSTLDRYLPVWIGVAMAVGLLVGRFIPGIDTALEAITVDGISLPIALGLLIMMYPVLAKVRYDRLDTVTGDRRLLVGSLVLNWIVGPALMFTLAWLLLPDLPEYRTGLIIVGLARCIAMVIIWNDLACGDREAAAVLVAINSIFQVIMFAVLGWFYLSVLPGWLGLQQTTIDTSSIQIAKSVLIFLAAARGLPVAQIRRTRQRPPVVPGFVPPEGRPVGTVRPVVHDRRIVRPARRTDHRAPGRCRAYRGAAAGLLRGHVGRRLPARLGTGLGLRADHVVGIHRRGQQLRARDRCRDRDLRCHLRPGARRCGRPVDRGPGLGRTGLCLTVPARTPALTHSLTSTRDRLIRSGIDQHGLG